MLSEWSGDVRCPARAISVTSGLRSERGEVAAAAEPGTRNLRRTAGGGGRFDRLQWLDQCCRRGGGWTDLCIQSGWQ